MRKRKTGTDLFSGKKYKGDGSLFWPDIGYWGAMWNDGCVFD
jgi:hypothetical protein